MNKFDPSRRGETGYGLVGWWGLYPWHPYECGCEWFDVVGDWSMGYRCIRCGKIFTDE